MKKITLALSLLFFAFQGNAQIADGSVARILLRQILTVLFTTCLIILQPEKL
ncbi:hypothetical protein [Flavobacterium sp. 3HN19-14]|uniref:hypothetical protein n=1 Tax=Flavobacterium sp. 3HN19-14 TaxID=3448133 RepID=UPI003EE2A549